MKNYYVMEASSNVAEYIRIKDFPEKIKLACSLSEFQYIDRSILYLELDENSGNVCQDIIYSEGVLLISEKVKNFFDSLKIDYLFYKKTVIEQSETGREEFYWLTVPFRIDCLDFEESEIDTVLESADKIVIDDDKTGRFDIFKLGGVTNLEIILTEKLADEMKKQATEQNLPIMAEYGDSLKFGIGGFAIKIANTEYDLEAVKAELEKLNKTSGTEATTQAQ